MDEWKQEFLAILDDWKASGSRNVIVSPDVDGLASAIMLSHRYDVRIIGIYSSQHLLMLDQFDSNDAKGALWLDHDVSHPDVRCVGQHLVLHKPEDRLPRRCESSWNPNIWAHQSWEDSFAGIAGRKRDKFPLGTVHYVAEALQIEPEDESQLALLAHSDGTWFVAQTYERNFRIWQDLMFAESAFVQEIGPSYIENRSALAAHAAFVHLLMEAGIKKSISRSRRAADLPDNLKALTGNQSVAGQVARNPQGFVENYLLALSAISHVLKKSVESGTSAGVLIQGTRESVYPNRIDDFDKLMVEEEIFSHAFTDFRTLSYTTGINL
jgi:hypothetical protein